MANVESINGVDKVAVDTDNIYYYFPSARVAVNTLSTQIAIRDNVDSDNIRSMLFADVVDKRSEVTAEALVDNWAVSGFFGTDNLDPSSILGLGWGNYSDSLATPSLSITTTPQVFTVDKLGASTYEGALPPNIRGVGTLWTGSVLTPTAVDDSYDIRLDFTIATKGGGVNKLDLVLDIGVGAGITIPIVERGLDLGKTPPFAESIGFPIFCRTTFFANGGRFFISTDAGTATITNRVVFIAMNSQFVP